MLSSFRRGRLWVLGFALILATCADVYDEGHDHLVCMYCWD